MPPPSHPASGVFERLRPRLTALSARIVGNAAEAEDVVQDCFLAWSATMRADVATPAAWLTTVVRNRSIDRLRQRRRDAAAACIALELVPDPVPALPEAALLRRAEVGAALARLLACLSPAERVAFVLHEVLECAHADIAAALRIKTENSRQHLARARRRLRVDNGEPPFDDKRCRDLVRRFQAAINGRDIPAVLALLADEQPVSVHSTDQPRARSANDTHYTLAHAA